MVKPMAADFDSCKHIESSFGYPWEINVTQPGFLGAAGMGGRLSLGWQAAIDGGALLAPEPHFSFFLCFHRLLSMSLFLKQDFFLCFHWLPSNPFMPHFLKDQICQESMYDGQQCCHSTSWNKSATCQTIAIKWKLQSPHWRPSLHLWGGRYLICDWVLGGNWMEPSEMQG